MPEVKRTLVKSGPELWAELSDPGCLARHLAPFGSVRIVSSVPESRVDWEGERGSGCVLLEPSGFGTRVVLGATVASDEAGGPAASGEAAPVQPAAPGEELEVEVARAGFWARLFRRAPVAAPAPERVTAVPAAFEAPEPSTPSSAPTMTDEQATAVLAEVLETLGAAHHRPFSRA